MEGLVANLSSVLFMWCINFPLMWAKEDKNGIVVGYILSIVSY